MELITLRSRPLPLVWVLAWLLCSGCQGTEWGEQLQRTLQIPREERAGSNSGEDSLPSPMGEPTQPVSFSTPLTAAEPEPEPSPLPNPLSVQEAPVTGRFTDLGEYPLAAAAVADLDRLGVFPEIQGSEFEPDRSIRRGEFARWLILANNAIHAQEPSRQIRLARPGERPVFLDVPEDHPDFPLIQALGTAGIATGDANQEFRPDSLLSRSAMVQLKSPLDLPPGEIEGTRADLEQDWGFTDAEEIPDEAVPAIVADRTLGEHSTILRAFGPIRAFDPRKPVTRAEAALALSAFGERTAAEAIERGPAPTPIPPRPALEPSPTPTPTPMATPMAEPTPAPSLTLTPTPPSRDQAPTSDPTESSNSNSSSPGSAPGEFVTPPDPIPESN